MSSSESTGSSKPKQQLNISAKEWVPAPKSISNLPPQHSAGAVNATGNNYDYDSTYANGGGTGGANYNNNNNNNNSRNRNDSYYNNSQGQSHRPGRDSHGRYSNNGTAANSNNNNQNQNSGFVPQTNPAVAMNVAMNPYQTNAYLLQQQQQQQYYQYAIQAQYMNQGGYPTQMMPPMMIGGPPYYSQPGVAGDLYHMPMNMASPMVYPSPFGPGPIAVPAAMTPAVLPSTSPVFSSSETSPLEPVDAVLAAPKPNLPLESPSIVSDSNDSANYVEAVIPDGSVAVTSAPTDSNDAVGESIETATDSGNVDHSHAAPIPDLQEQLLPESDDKGLGSNVRGDENLESTLGQVYSRETLLSLYRPQSLPQSLLQFYPGLDSDGAKDPSQSVGFGKEAVALYLRSSPKAGGGMGMGGSRDFHRADSRDFGGHGSSGRRDFRDNREVVRDRERDRDGRLQGATSSIRVNTAIAGDVDVEDGQNSSAPSPQLFFGGGRRGGSNTPHPDASQDPAPFGSSSAFGRPSTLFKSSEPENSADAIIKRATLILNKLSVTKFEKLSNEFVEIISVGDCDHDLLAKVVELLVTKAQMEEHFCFMYADLCRKIYKDWDELILENQPDLSPATIAAADTEASKDAEKNNGDGDGDGGDNKQMTKGKLFRELLLVRCQSEFENDRVKGLEDIRAMADLTAEERLEKEVLLKKRYTGHMRFIGEIYIKELVQANIINEFCLSVLVQASDEEQLVCLCKLFQTVGDKIEKYYAKKARSKKGKERKLNEIIPAHFAAIENIAETHPSSRVRFMLRDLIDMRANNWTARREEEKVMDLNETRMVAGGQGGPSAVRTGSGASSSQPTAVPDVPVPSAPAPPPAPLAAIEDEWRVVTKGAKKEKVTPSAAPPPPPTVSSLSTKGTAGSGSSQNTNSKKSQQSLINSPSKKASAPLRLGQAQAGVKKYGEDKASSSSASSKGPIAPPAASESEEQSPAAEGDDSSSLIAPLTAQVAVAPVSFSPLSPHLKKKVQSAAEEFYFNGLLEEGVAVLRELLIPPTQTADLFKILLLHMLEQKKDQVGALCLLLLNLSGGEQPLLSAEAVAAGLQLFLEELDEICIDIPLAGAQGAKMAGEMVARGLLSLSFFALLPVDGNFRSSPRAADFVLQVLRHLSADRGEDSARSLFRDAHIDLLAWVVPPPRQSQEHCLDELVEKYGVRFVISADLT